MSKVNQFLNTYKEDVAFVHELTHKLSWFYSYVNLTKLNLSFNLESINPYTFDVLASFELNLCQTNSLRLNIRVASMINYCTFYHNFLFRYLLPFSKFKLSFNIVY